MKSYSVLQLQELKFAAEILRACPQISFQTANLLNKDTLLLEAGIKEYQQEATLLRERGEAMDKENGEEAAKYSSEIVALNNKKFDINIAYIPYTEFVNIQGDKEVTYGDGTMRKFSYREAYFSLLGEIITE